MQDTQGVLFSIKHIFYDKMDVKIFYFDEAIFKKKSRNDSNATEEKEA